TDPQTLHEQPTLTVTPRGPLWACATGPLTWSVSPALPAGASFSTSTGEIVWTPACGEAGSYGPFTLTATAATLESGSSNAFKIDVTHKTGTVSYGTISDPQTLAERSSLTITPSATLGACAAGPVAWSVSPALPAGATFSTSTGQIVWTPDCSAAAGGVSGTYGPFTLTATAATTEAGSSNAFGIHVTDTPVAIGPPTAATATQLMTGNAPGDRTAITIQFTAPAGATAYKVYRAPFGHYPEYDEAGGATPPQPTAYPPASPWVLTGVTLDGGSDIPPARDYWYYAVYAQNACGDFSVASTMTTGTLDYHLGDVTDGVTPGLGDDLVQSEDISELGAHYGVTLALADPFGYLDVGPTTTTYVDGRPLTDHKVNFEDLAMFAIDFETVSAPARPSTPASAKRAALKAAAADLLTIQTPDHVAAGTALKVPLAFEGTGLVQALSVSLSWDPAVVTPVGQAPGELIFTLGGTALSPKPGTVDAAALGVGAGLLGTGELATVSFKALTAGDPKIRVETVVARDAHNRSITVNASRQVVTPELPTVTTLQLVGQNPFRQSVSLAASLAAPGPMELAVFSVDGRRLRTLASGVHEPGNYPFVWDGRDERGSAVSTGVFYVRFLAGSVRQTRAITYPR